MKKIGLMLIIGLLGACASTPKQEETQQSSSIPPSEIAGPASIDTPNVSEIDPFTDQSSALHVLDHRYIYFDFDSYVVKSEYEPTLKLHSDYLLSKWYNSRQPLSLQGHTDERGTAEYNMALGQKRADAVKQIMVTAYGVPSHKLETISYGKEHPIMIGHDEAAWSKNRRVVIVYPGESLQ